MLRVASSGPLRFFLVVTDLKWRVEDVGEKVGEEDLAAWQGSSADLCAFLSGKDTQSPATIKSEKRPRIPSFKLLVAMDWQWQVMCGWGLKSFVPVPQDEKIALRKRPHVTFALDTASDNMCVASYLLGKGLRITILPDPIHKIWRAPWGGVKEAVLASTVFLAGIVCSLERGPWSGEQYFEQMRLTAEEIVRLCHAQLRDL